MNAPSNIIGMVLTLDVGVLIVFSIAWALFHELNSLANTSCQISDTELRKLFLWYAIPMEKQDHCLTKELWNIWKDCLASIKMIFFSYIALEIGDYIDWSILKNWSILKTIESLFIWAVLILIIVVNLKMLNRVTNISFWKSYTRNRRRLSILMMDTPRVIRNLPRTSYEQKMRRSYKLNSRNLQVKKI